MRFLYLIDDCSANDDIAELKKLFNDSPELFFTSQYTSAALNRTTSTEIFNFWLEIHSKHGIELKYDFEIFESYASIKFWNNAFKKYNLMPPKSDQCSYVRIAENVISDALCENPNDHEIKEGCTCAWDRAEDPRGAQSITVTQLIEACEIMYELYNDSNLFELVFHQWCDHIDFLKWIYSRGFSHGGTMSLFFKKDMADFCQNNLIPQGQKFQFSVNLDKEVVLREIINEYDFDFFITGEKHLTNAKIEDIINICVENKTRDRKLYFYFEIGTQVISYCIEHDVGTMALITE